MSKSDASDSDGSESASDSEQNDPPSSQVTDAEQYELMQRAHAGLVPRYSLHKLPSRGLEGSGG